MPKLVAKPMDANVRYALADALYKNAQDLLLYLYERWQDEKEHEDIKDYEKPLHDLLLKANAENVVMKSRPFGFICTIGGGVYQYSVTARVYAFKRIK